MLDPLYYIWMLWVAVKWLANWVWIAIFYMKITQKISLHKPEIIVSSDTADKKAELPWQELIVEKNCWQSINRFEIIYMEGPAVKSVFPSFNKSRLASLRLRERLLLDPLFIWGIIIFNIQWIPWYAVKWLANLVLILRYIL